MNHTHIAIAIIVGAALVAGAIFFAPSAPPNTAVAETAPSPAEQLTDVTRSGEARNLYGNPDALTTIVEFSDFECPFCARLHPTLKRIVDESDGGINWEYRHLPLTSHPLAEPAAVASECVARYAGNAAFWQFTDTLFRTMQHSRDNYRTLALGTGVSEADYDSCVETNETLEIVRDDTATARRLGGTGTPFNVIVFADGSTRPVSGALPYEQWITLLQGAN